MQINAETSLDLEPPAAPERLLLVTNKPASRVRVPIPSSAIPLLVWQIFFFFIPLFFVIAFSFFRKGTYGGIVYSFNLDNYARAFDPVYFTIFLNSLEIAAGTSVMCLAVGFPIAWIMTKTTPAIRNLLIIGLMLPFLTNCVIRACAIKLILGPEGPINFLLLKMGIVDSAILLTDSLTAVWIGMVAAYLPFLVLPIYVTLEKFDWSLLEAARDLGASSRQCFFKILVPIIKPGLMTGVMLVFIPALCEFILPDFLGGAKNMLLGGLIAEQFLKARDWPFGSALSMLLLLVILGTTHIQKMLSNARIEK